MDVHLEPLLDARAVAAILQIHPKTVMRLARTGVLPGLRYLGYWRFRSSDIAHWLDAHAYPPSAPRPSQ